MHYTVKKLFNFPFYTEGPAVDREGNFYITTLTGGEIIRLDTQGKQSVWGKYGCPNGQFIRSDGLHWVCDPQQAAIHEFDTNGRFQRSVLHRFCAGAIVQSPNDLLLDSQENLYFTDSIRVDGKVFFKDSHGTERLVANGIDYANGLVLSPDEKRLYVAESYQNRILVIELSEPGLARGKPQVFVNLPHHSLANPIHNLPDGLALDQQGRIWVAHYGMQALQVLSAQGHWLFSIDTTLPLTSNVCLVSDAPDRKVLLVTGGSGEPGPGGAVLVTVYFPSEQS
ncbi:SMP-30/gluconolactonase/LRE family protein [Larkinella harenae]